MPSFPRKCTTLHLTLRLDRHHRYCFFCFFFCCCCHHDLIKQFCRKRRFFVDDLHKWKFVFPSEDILISLRHFLFLFHPHRLTNIRVSSSECLFGDVSPIERIWISFIVEFIEFYYWFFSWVFLLLRANFLSFWLYYVNVCVIQVLPLGSF